MTLEKAREKRQELNTLYLCGKIRKSEYMRRVARLRNQLGR
jgi:hypothetical protein